jgi:hypothetical protein
VIAVVRILQGSRGRHGPRQEKVSLVHHSDAKPALDEGIQAPDVGFPVQSIALHERLHRSNGSSGLVGPDC